MDRKFTGFVIVVFLIMLLFHTNSNLTHIYNKCSKFVVCPFKFITGMECPGCGMMRAFWELAGFNVKQALRYNPFSIVLLVLCVVEFLFYKKVPRTLQTLYKYLLVLVLIWWLLFRVFPALL